MSIGGFPLPALADTVLINISPFLPKLYFCYNMHTISGFADCMPDSNMHKIFLHNNMENIFWENGNFKVMFTFILASRNTEKLSFTDSILQN